MTKYSEAFKLSVVEGLARSIFYYQQHALLAEDKHAKVKETIKTIYHCHKGRYGYNTGPSPY